MRHAVIALVFAAGCSSSGLALDEPLNTHAQGRVYVSEGPRGSALSAGFLRYTVVPPAGSAGTPIGACSVHQRVGASSSTNASPERLAAGALQVRGLGAAASIAYNENDPLGAGYALTRADELGEHVEVSADGAAFPGFSLSVDAPAKTTLTAPLPVDDRLAIDRATDLRIAWSPPTTGVVAVQLYQDGDLTEGQQRAVTCSFPGEDGGGLIPAPALAGFQVNRTGLYTMALAFAWRGARVIGDDWGVQLSVERELLTPVGPMKTAIGIDFR